MNNTTFHTGTKGAATTTATATATATATTAAAATTTTTTTTTTTGQIRVTGRGLPKAPVPQRPHLLRGTTPQILCFWLTGACPRPLAIKPTSIHEPSCA